MTRRVSLTLLALTVLVGACSSASNQADPDGGTRNPDGGDPDGGVPAVTGQCRIEGYPCSLADVSPEARALSLQYADAVRTRLDAGESFEDVAAWLGAQEDVVHVIGDSSSLRFRVTGGAAEWFYDPGPGIARPSPSDPVAKSAARNSEPPVPKAVVRRDDSDTEIKKKALILEPFQEFIATPVDPWMDELRELHDYNRVDYHQDRDVLDEHFGNWNDYRFIWVTTHGKHLPTDMPTYSALFSGRMCDEFGWLREELIDLGNGDQPTQDEDVELRELFGKSRTYIEQTATPEQVSRWKAYEDRELAAVTSEGVFCGNLKMEWIDVPGNTPGEGFLSNVIIKYWYYDGTWFQENYPSGLKNALVYQRACSSDALPLEVASGERGAILGWTDTINSADDDQTIAVLFDGLITQGETLQEAMKDVADAGLDEFTRGDKNPKLKLRSTGDGGQNIRVREIISITDSVFLEPFPDEGGMLEAREITASNETIVDVTVVIVGFAERKGEEFEVQFFDGSGREISRKLEVDEPTMGKTVMTIPVSLNQAIRTPTEVEIEARVTLPEETGTVYSRHPIKLTVGPAIEELWTLNVGGAGTARGDFVFAPFPVGIMDDQGRVLWHVSLAQLSDFVVPMANVLILDHNGRTPECTGQTGNFEAVVTVLFDTSPMPTEGFGGGLGEGECGDSVNVEIVSFSKEEDLVANISGTICHWERVGEEVVVNPVPINGRFQMPQGGCGAPPGGDLVGSFYASEEPSACLDIYPNAAIAPAFEETCAQGGGIVCSDEPCSTAGQIGQCDYRDDAVNISFIGQVQHFYPGDWPSVGELQGACELQLGTWTTGAPPMP